MARSPQIPILMPFRTHQLVATLALACSLPLASSSARAETCTFLKPIGGDGATNIVSKRVERPKVGPLSMLLGRTNWDTDFAVDKPYSSYKLFFTADSTDAKAKYPVRGFFKFTDNTSLQLFDEEISPPVGTGKMYGPFKAVAGKSISQINFKVGASKDPDATGFIYRISVQGCN